MGSTNSTDSSMNQLESTHKRGKSLSNKINKKAKDTKEIVHSAKTAISELFENQSKSLQSLTKNIVSQLDEQFLKETFLDLSMQAGLQTFEMSTSEYKDQRCMVIRTVIQHAMQVTFIPCFMRAFEEKSNALATLVDPESRSHLFTELKKDVSGFLEFSTAVFAAILSCLELPFADLNMIIETALFNPRSTTSEPLQDSKSFVACFYSAYFLDNTDFEDSLKLDIPNAKMQETRDIRELKDQMKRSRFYPREKTSIVQSLRSFNKSGDLNKVVRSLLILAKQFSDEITQITTHRPEGASSRIKQNVQLVTLFNTSGLYTLCKFIVEQCLNAIGAEGQHFITTIYIAYTHIIETIKKSKSTELQSIPSQNNTVNELETIPTSASLN